MSTGNNSSNLAYVFFQYEGLVYTRVFTSLQAAYKASCTNKTKERMDLGVELGVSPNLEQALKQIPATAKPLIGMGSIEIWAEAAQPTMGNA
jgi:hypothetical protein